MAEFVTYISMIITALAAIWLIAVGVVMLCLPHKALLALSKAGSTVFVNYTELTLRLLAGAGFVGVAARTPYPAAFFYTGIFLGVTSVVLMLIPRRWHASYALYWSRRIPPIAVKLLSPAPVILGAAILFMLA